MSIPEHDLFLGWIVDPKILLAETKARLRREQERRASKWGNVSEPAEKLLKTVGFQNCLQYIMRTGEYPEVWYFSNPIFAGVLYPLPAASRSRRFGNQSGHVPNAGPSHSYTIYLNSTRVLMGGHGILLQPERCSQPANMVGNASRAHPMLYVQRPSNTGGPYVGDADYSWRSRQAQLDAVRNQCLTAFESVFLSESPAILADHVFKHKPCDGGSEVLKGYLVWRMIWHSKVFREGALPLPSTLATLVKHMRAVERLQLWGDVVNDGLLFQCGRLDRKTIAYTYYQNPECVLYLVKNCKHWVQECSWLNDFVGHRRSMNTAQFNLAKTAAQRAGTAMRKLVIAEVQQTGEHPVGVDSRPRLEVQARLRFKEIRSALLADPSLASRRTGVASSRLGHAGANGYGEPSRC